MKIWIVEDEAPIRRLLVTMIAGIAKGKHEIVEFVDSELALEALQSEQDAPDIFLLDVQLPGMSGIDLCHKVREIMPTTSENLPYLIILTGSDSSETLSKALDAGANDYLTKPVHPKLLRSRLGVAERLVEQAQESAGVDYARGVLAYTMHTLALPLCVVEVGEGDSLEVWYGNKAFVELMEAKVPVLQGKDIAELQGWDPAMKKDVLESLQHVGGTFKGRLLASTEIMGRDGWRLQALSRTEHQDGSDAHAVLIFEPMG